MTSYPDGWTVRRAREAYFAATGLSEKGYTARWAWLRVGPLSLPLPNTSGRVRVIRLHDLHHIATGYDTSWRGEGEIGAWELGGGCGRHLAAWWLNGSAALIGLVIAPRRVWRAFRRGRQSRTLYRVRDGGFDEDYLDLEVGELRALLRLQ
jgi:hypothetical protein